MTEVGRRNNWQVLRDVLVACRDGALKTQAYYNANSNYMHVGPFIKEALAAGMLRQEGRRFYTTNKGKEFLGWVYALEHMLQPA